MSETTGDRIARHLRLIRASWDHMLPDAPRMGHGEPVKGSKEPPPAAPIGVVSLRREVCEGLVSWVRLVISDAIDVNGQRMDVRLDGKDAPGMAGWLLRWADWLGEHEAAEAADDELGTFARRCDDVVTQRRKRRFKVGPCIDHAMTDMAEKVPCPGTLYAILSNEDDLLPSVLRCDADPEHAYSASDWRRLGDRIASRVTAEEAVTNLARRIVGT